MRLTLSRLSLLTLGVFLLTACPSPPPDFDPGLVIGTLGKVSISTTTPQVGNLVEVTVRGIVSYPTTGFTSTKKISTSIGFVLTLDPTDPDDPIARRAFCPATLQSPNPLPSGVTLQSGSSLSKSLDLTLESGQRINFEHTVRFTSSTPQQVYMRVVQWANDLGQGLGGHGGQQNLLGCYLETKRAADDSISPNFIEFR